MMGFVNQGMLRQYYLKEGQEFTDCFFAEEDFIGNYISYFSKEVSSTFTVAMEPCELIVIPFEQLQKLSTEIPTIEAFSKIIGDQKLMEMHKRNSSLLMDTPEERYDALLSNKADLHNRVPQYIITQYLGIRPESLSRIRKRKLS